MLKSWFEDIDSYFDRDPAVRSRLEVVLCYPGFHAIAIYRLTHWLWNHKLKLLARATANLARMLTGIEIHPGATIGKRLFIDHGLGVVIGETAKVGDNVTIYHDVTLGGTSLKQEIRHPQIEDDVIIGAGAQLLGPIQVGKGARIGANAVVVKDVEAGTTMVGIPARAVHASQTEFVKTFSAYGTPDETDDSLDDLVTDLSEKVVSLQERIEALESKEKAA